MMRRVRTALLLLTGLCMQRSAITLLANDSLILSQRIDSQIQKRLDAEGLHFASPADDAEFLRRVMLDLHGIVPTKEQTLAFLSRTEHDKRARLLDELLASSRFGEHFGDIWRRYLLSPLVSGERARSDRFAGWLADRFNSDSWDHTVQELLTATGTLDSNAATIYLVEGNFPLGVTDLTDLTSRYFLGIRLNCAQCHNHPFAEWKQQDYWGMAAFFAQIQTPGRPKKVYVAGVQDDTKATLASLRGADMIEGFQSRRPTYLGGDESPGSEDTDRQALARWMTSPENPFFARATVNRMWWHLFGRGIINPVDDMHSGNVPSHRELLELMSQEFAESGFDLKFLCRAIVLSRTYQQTSRPGDQPVREAQLFAKMSIKVLSAEQLYDSLIAILGPPGKTPEIDARLGTRHEFLQFFATEGDPTHYERGIPQILRMMNSPQFSGSQIAELVSRTAATGRSAESVIDELFVTILSRHPRPGEVQLAQAEFERAGSAHEAWLELAWTLLMSSEFALNH